nr:extracellular solute-binding protein [Phycisphaerae bacterium]
AGWYADLSDFIKTSAAKDYDFADISAGLVKDASYQGRVMGVPLNIEGPVLYYRKDLFQKCGVSLPKNGVLFHRRQQEQGVNFCSSKHGLFGPPITRRDKDERLLCCLCFLLLILFTSRPHERSQA